jgi:hypothetical protein
MPASDMNLAYYEIAPQPRMKSPYRPVDRVLWNQVSSRRGNYCDSEKNASEAISVLFEFLQERIIEKDDTVNRSFLIQVIPSLTGDWPPEMANQSQPISQVN